MSEAELRLELSTLARSLFERGFSVGTAGNISARLPDGILMTPTNSRLGDIHPDRISKLSPDGEHVAGDKPSKEVFLHRAFYETKPECGAVVHLHSTYATLLSCRDDIDPSDCFPPLTPYVVMRVGRVPMVEYVRPGDPRSGDLIRALDGAFDAVLLANHGPVVTGKTLFSAVAAAEELEETAKLLALSRGFDVRILTDENVDELNRVFGRI